MEVCLRANEKRLSAASVDQALRFSKAIEISMRLPRLKSLFIQVSFEFGHPQDRNKKLHPGIMTEWIDRFEIAARDILIRDRPRVRVTVERPGVAEESQNPQDLEVRKELCFAPAFPFIPCSFGARV